ncbi:LuxR C-terminal-related transcriptional regulator [Aeromicrobium massiliense]|uniref:LuxR C-terminal-related transcriptional regulator n=1 Tax=Aeromicrobium massiliense TaxID=1464554 RepID=UPI0005784326|nr:LuxR C-terminal-related transcriptional regulator [Aeromicrobium massiliense]
MAPQSEGSGPSSREHPQRIASDVGWPGVPDRPAHFLPRPRLLALLDAGPTCPLVLLSAPAGTGKTTLAADWARSRAPGRLEWITLDPGDAFWPAFGSALRRLGVDVAPGALVAADRPLDPAARRGVACAVAAESERLTVVVDGYDMTSPEVAADLDFLLRHTGHRLRVVLLTRADPVLPLYRYRLEETMVEVRMADLAFTDGEADALMRLLGVPLHQESVHALDEYVGGWVTGLRFAAKRLAGRPDPDLEVEQVVSRSENVAEYLVGEVLASHSAEVRELLLTLSIPDTIRPGLDEALAGRCAGRRLAALATVNVLIEHVPGQAGCYRLHPLFRDMLRAELAYESPERLLALRCRAAAWFAGQGMLGAAIHHYAAAGAWQEAATAVVDHAALAQLVAAPDAAAWVRTMREMPADLDDPAASVVRAALALVDRDHAGFDAALARADGGGTGTATAHAVASAVSVLRAVRARSERDPEQAQACADEAAEALAAGSAPPPDLAALVHATRGVAAVRRGRLDEARRHFEDGAAAGPCGGAPVAECVGFLAVLACCEGDLVRAERHARRAVELATATGLPPGERPAPAEVALAWVALERFDLRAAGDHLRVASQSRAVLEEPVTGTLLVLLRARLTVAQGDRTGARARLTESCVPQGGPSDWATEQIRVEAAQLDVARNEPEAALAAIQAAGGPSASAAATLVAAQARLAMRDDAAARDVLAVARDDHAPLPVRVTAWLVECVRLQRRGRAQEAHGALVAALELAHEPRVRRPFHDAASVVRQLLVRDERLANRHAWLVERTPGGTPPAARPHRTAPVPEQHPAPTERLTEKELEVLGHLADLLSTEEIAAAMYISVNTVRTHVRNILRKLGVTRRNAAVRAAREHQLLPT